MSKLFEIHEDASPEGDYIMELLTPEGVTFTVTAVGSMDGLVDIVDSLSFRATVNEAHHKTHMLNLLVQQWRQFKLNHKKALAHTE